MFAPDPKLRVLIEASAGFVRLPVFVYKGKSYTPGELLEGWILAESGCDPRARRYEPHLDRLARVGAPPDADTAGQDDGDLEDDASYGLLQILGSNARAMVGARPGTPLKFGFLFRPMANLALCLRFFLEECMAPVYRLNPHETDQERLVRALCRYNGGPTGDAVVNGDFRLRAYVDRVATHCALARKLRGAE
jgi:hypothetical protein